MKAIKVNADYESVLFHQSPQPKMNEVIEFLALFLEENPLLSSKKYSDIYLNYVAEVRGSRPVIVNSGEALNWWGELKNLEIEKWLNSKITSAEFGIAESWNQHTSVLLQDSDLQKLKDFQIPMMTKNPFDMSGRGFRIYPDGVITKELKNFPLILEPLLDRKYDFSQYIFPDGQSIAYQNIVDKKFQFKGSLFKNWKKPVVDNLAFYNEVSSAEWEIFNERINKLKTYYENKKPFSELEFGFSIDSLIYRQDGNLKIHPVCELNFRRTMGRVAYDLSRKYAKTKEWTLFLLLPQTPQAFEKLLPILNKDELILLSPPGSRFEVLFLMANSEIEGREILQAIKNLLLLVELPVNI